MPGRGVEEPGGRGGPGADGLDRDADRAGRSRGLDHGGGLGGGDRRHLGRVARRVGLAGVGEHAAQAQVRLGGHDAGQAAASAGRTPQRRRPLSISIQTSSTRPAAAAATASRAGALRAVHREGQRHPPGQAHGTLQLRCGHDLEGDEDRRVDAAVDERLGLVELGHRHPDRAGGQLAARDRDRLVGLEVGPQSDPAGSGRASAIRSMLRVEPIEVDEQGGRVDGPPVPADLGGRRALGRDRHAGAAMQCDFSHRRIVQVRCQTLEARRAPLRPPVRTSAG